MIHSRIYTIDQFYLNKRRQKIFMNRVREIKQKF